MRKLATIVGLMILVPSIAPASNTAFKINYALRQASSSHPNDCGPGESSSNWVSPPYFFLPDGDITNSSQTARDWCIDLNGGANRNTPIFTITRFNTAFDTFTTKACANPLPVFGLMPGTAYSLVLEIGVDDGEVIDIVGSHDDDFAPNKGGTATITLINTRSINFSSLNWVSVPPSVRATNMQDLCINVNGAAAQNTPVTQIQWFNTCEDVFITKSCANPAPGPDLIPGAGYAFVPGDLTDQQISFIVY